MKKSVLAIILLMGILSFVSVPALAWQDICKADNTAPYCKNVGKGAYNATGMIRDIRLGTIIGVAWRPKGSLIGMHGRTAKRNAHYYIIDDGKPNPFIRMCAEIDCK